MTVDDEKLKWLLRSCRLFAHEYLKIKTSPILDGLVWDLSESIADLEMDTWGTTNRGPTKVLGKEPGLDQQKEATAQG